MSLIPNTLDISETQILQNLREIQSRNNVKPSESLDGLNFSIEMETGTGKIILYFEEPYLNF